MDLQSTTQHLHIVIPPSPIIMFLPDGIVGRWSENRTDSVFDWSAFDHTLTSDAPIIIDKVVLKPKVQTLIALVFTMPRKTIVLLHRIHIMLVFTGAPLLPWAFCVRAGNSQIPKYKNKHKHKDKTQHITLIRRFDQQGWLPSNCWGVRRQKWMKIGKECLFLDFIIYCLCQSYY